MEAALGEFSTHGYAGSSTRSITARAGVNLGALTYYFEGKPSLYRAVLDHIAERAAAIIAPIAEAAMAVLNDPQAPRSTLRQAILSFLDQILDAMVTKGQGEWDPRWSLMMSRAEFEPPEGEPWPFKLLSAAVMQPLAGLVARARGKLAVDEECQLTAIALLGQVLAFKPVPAGGLPAMGWERVTRPRLEAIRKVVHGSVAAVLDYQCAAAS